MRPTPRALPLFPTHRFAPRLLAAALLLWGPAAGAQQPKYGFLSDKVELTKMREGQLVAVEIPVDPMPYWWLVLEYGQLPGTIYTKKWYWEEGKSLGDNAYQQIRKRALELKADHDALAGEMRESAARIDQAEKEPGMQRGELLLIMDEHVKRYDYRIGELEARLGKDHMLPLRKELNQMSNRKGRAFKSLDAIQKKQAYAAMLKNSEKFRQEALERAAERVKSGKGTEQDAQLVEEMFGGKTRKGDVKPGDHSKPGDAAKPKVEGDTPKKIEAPESKKKVDPDASNSKVKPIEKKDEEPGFFGKAWDWLGSPGATTVMLGVVGAAVGGVLSGGNAGGFLAGGALGLGLGALGNTYLRKSPSGSEAAAPACIQVTAGEFTEIVRGECPKDNKLKRSDGQMLTISDCKVVECPKG